MPPPTPLFCIYSAFPLSDGLTPYLDGQHPEQGRSTPLHTRSGKFLTRKKVSKNADTSYPKNEPMII
ncbi:MULTISPECIES: hypothetical protein [unclassified Neisseria]|uniref:hypothetical protein n=1 Tax=unclassified Neisseria TaxID=2623750 RepID=UPI002665FA27|nr:MULTISPECIES: hypothetical protein [unclassified Neisseria]MDO1509562.1 hypothetical protein [Neisseria sp. MVDL19-042950]MDO1515666.1 hypothetical protein [Neisseria sp. MVDL18-041461]MDO1563511.1 hypothetical protein [Neisseria sp. MVDL20-010259]